MGHYNVHCCLSGVPIEYGDEVVAWPLQKEYARGIGYRESWIPAGLPIMGWYDSYGGVDDVHGNILLSGDQHIAMCHMKMWTQLTDFWDNRDGSIKDEDLLSQIRGAREKHKKDQDFLKKELKKINNKRVRDHWTKLYEPNLYFFQQGCMTALYWLKDIYLMEFAKDQKYSYEFTKKWSRENTTGVFEKIIYDLVYGNYDEKALRPILKDLVRLVIAHKIMVPIMGKKIQSTMDTHAYQDSNYRREAEYFSMVNEILNSKVEKHSKCKY